MGVKAYSEVMNITTTGKGTKKMYKKDKKSLEIKFNCRNANNSQSTVNDHQ